MASDFAAFRRTGGDVSHRVHRKHLPAVAERRGAGFAGTLIGIGVIGFAPALIVATLGSVLGFMTAYVLGRYFEQHFVSGRYHRYLPVNAIHQVERLFTASVTA